MRQQAEFHCSTPISFRGMMVCGINWCGKSNFPFVEVPPALFSDKKQNGSRFKSRMHTIFRIFGHPLNEQEPGRYEQSIIHTNWLQTKSVRADGQEKTSHLYDNRKPFIDFVITVRPRLIIFTSANLLEAFAKAVVSDQALRRQLGPTIHGIVCKRYPADAYGRDYAVCTLRLKHCVAVSIPHPTGARGLTDEYLSNMARDMKRRISEYRKEARC